MSDETSEFSAKDIRVEPINSATAREAVKLWHYSGKVAANSQLHFGVFLDGRLEGAMQFGPSMDKNKTLALVPGTSWNGFLELNRMAFSDVLPRNSESRALGYALRLIKKTYPHIDWILSFSDGTQCGDGIIYRASGFLLCGAKKNTTLCRLPSGEIIANISYRNDPKRIAEVSGASRLPEGTEKLPGYQFRYIYFLNPAARERLAAEVLPFSKIDELKGRMYKGVALK